MGRTKISYNPATMPKLAYELARDGASIQGIARALGIHRATLSRWRNLYAELDDAINRGRMISDGKVESSLFLRAVGFEITETETWFKVGKDGKLQKHRVKVTKKVIPPDTMACITWLKCRQPERWGDRAIGTSDEEKLMRLIESMEAAARACLCSYGNQA
ncbi:MAG: helix-turn-helix domain-containing protein [Armatimonadota bacterium]|nr:helix-turn-helix domain-containing protein [Armatimonadota bacterium]